MFLHIIIVVILASYHPPALATVGSTMCSQIHVQIMHSLAYLQDLHLVNLKTTVVICSFNCLIALRPSVVPIIIAILSCVS